jgi:glycosyltransferase involved in cell wall biosynthesis
MLRAVKLLNFGLPGSMNLLTFSLPKTWRLIFQGGGNHHRLLHRLVDYFGIAHERVEIRHHNPDVLKVIGESDLLVMPSIVEGMPFALLEGMAGGRAAVAAPVAGIPEVVRTGETGWLARSTDPADFNDALNSAWCERHRWQELGSAAQALVARKFNQQSTIGTIIEALNDDLV